MSLKHYKDYHGSPKPITESALFRALQGEISSVRKVYDAIPMNELWTVPQIIAELKRVGVTNLGLTQVVGTCQLLRAKGVIKEVGVKNYIRIPVVPVSKKNKTIINESEIKIMKDQKNKSPKPAAPAECSLKRASSALLSLAADLETLSGVMAAPSAEHEARILELQAEIGELSVENSRLAGGLKEAHKREDEAKRIGKEWHDKLATEKERHNATRDELHRVQGEVERLSADVAKFAQLKLLLSGGL